MTNRIQKGDLQVSEELDKLISEKVCVNIDVEPEQFWNSFNEVVKEFTPRNKALLAEREELQTKIDNWHKENKEFDKETYKSSLKEFQNCSGSTSIFTQTFSLINLSNSSLT